MFFKGLGVNFCLFENAHLFQKRWLLQKNVELSFLPLFSGCSTYCINASFCTLREYVTLHDGHFCFPFVFVYPHTCVTSDYYVETRAVEN